MLGFAMDQLRDTLDILDRLISFPSVTGEGNLELAGFLANRLSECGAQVRMQLHPDGHQANLFATIGPETDGGIVLSGHTDVVPALEDGWISDPFEMRQEYGQAYGRGSCDMKGFIAAAVAMAPHFAELNLKRPLHFAFTYDEEVGCLGARQLVNEMREWDFRPSVSIIGEPTMMRIIEGHKGCCEYTTRFAGLEGHASNPGAGVNAVEYGARFISRLLQVGEELKARAPETSRFEPPHTTVQAGTISGGSARNVIAGQCEVEWEMRPVSSADYKFAREKMRLYCEEVLLPAMREVSPDADIMTEVIGEVDGLEPMSENEARDIVAELTGANGADLVAFGTEAGLFQSLGMSAVVCGPGSIEQAHKANEFVSLDQLQACLGMIEGLKRKLT